MFRGYYACKLWIAMKQHFTSKKFNFFTNAGRIRYDLEHYIQRNDFKSFEGLAKRFTVQEYVIYLASNLMYGCSDMIWDYGHGVSNYNLFLTRRETINQIFNQDIHTLFQNQVRISDGREILSHLTRGNITFETVSILNTFFHLTSCFAQVPEKVLLDPLLLRIDKTIIPQGERFLGFVKITPEIHSYIIHNFRI